MFLEYVYIDAQVNVRANHPLTCVHHANQLSETSLKIHVLQMPMSFNLKYSKKKLFHLYHVMLKGGLQEQCLGGNNKTRV